MKRVLVRIVVLLAIAAAVFFFWRKRVDGKGELVLSGSIEARLVEVGSLVGGRVAEVRIEEGAEVAAGAVLVVLESDLVDRQIDGQRAAIAEAAAAVALAEAGPRSEARARARIVLRNARLLAATRTRAIATSAATCSQRSMKVAPRKTMR